MVVQTQEIKLSDLECFKFQLEMMNMAKNGVTISDHQKRQGGRKSVKGTDSKTSLFICKLNYRGNQVSL